MASPVIAIAPKIDKLPTLKVNFGGADPDKAGVLSSISSTLDASGKGQITIENYDGLNNATFAADKIAAQREFIKIDIDCGGDAAKIQKVAHAYAKLMAGVGRTGAHDALNPEAIEAGLKELLSHGTVTGKNHWTGPSAKVHLEPRFKQMLDQTNSIVGAGDYIVKPATDLEHALNVVLDRHTLSIPGPSTGVSEMRVICDIRRAYIEIVDGAGANAQRMKFEVKDLTNPVGDASALDTQAERLMQRVFGQDLLGTSVDCYYAKLKAENSKGDEIARNSALFKALRENELAAEFSHLQIVDAAIRVTACDQGLKITRGSINGKNQTAMLDVDGRVEMSRFISYGNAGISLNSPNSKITDCTFRKDTVISGDLTGSRISAGCEFYDVLWVAKAHGVQIEGLGKNLAGRWKGTLIDEACLDQASQLIELLGLVPFEREPEVVATRIAKILNDQSIVDLFEKNGIFKTRAGSQLNGVESLEIAEPEEIGQRKASLQAYPNAGGKISYKVKFSFLKNEFGETEDREADFGTKAEALENIRALFRHPMRGYFEALDQQIEAAARAQAEAAAEAGAGGGGRGGRGGGGRGGRGGSGGGRGGY